VIPCLKKKKTGQVPIMQAMFTLLSLWPLSSRHPQFLLPGSSHRPYNYLPVLLISSQPTVQVTLFKVMSFLCSKPESASPLADIKHPTSCKTHKGCIPFPSLCLWPRFSFAAWFTCSTSPKVPTSPDNPQRCQHSCFHHSLQVFSKGH
jgi:hypothetical protein